mgnify:CR=1 FL=1
MSNAWHAPPPESLASPRSPHRTQDLHPGIRRFDGQRPVLCRGGLAAASIASTGGLKEAGTRRPVSDAGNRQKAREPGPRKGLELATAPRQGGRCPISRPTSATSIISAKRFPGPRTARCDLCRLAGTEDAGQRPIHKRWYLEFVVRPRFTSASDRSDTPWSSCTLDEADPDGQAPHRRPRL